MFARFSKDIRPSSVEARFWGLALILTVFGVFTCRLSATIVIPQDFNQPIPSPGDPESESGKGKMDDVVIDVTEHFVIDDLDVAVSLDHQSFYDLEIVLSRAGETITLNFNSNDSFLTRDENDRQVPIGGFNRFLFDDEAPISIKDAIPPFDQRFRPADGKLSDFDGKDAFGQWRLQIQDYWPADTGYLKRVELIISAPEPSMVCILGAMMLFVRLIKPHKPG